jgi:hypothetical protein
VWQSVISDPRPDGYSESGLGCVAETAGVGVGDASADAALYYVNDAPLLTYLGVKADHPRFKPTLYEAERAKHELRMVANDPAAADRSRVSVLPANSKFPLTRTVTHVLWAMYGLITPGSEQKPHRHQSIALDFIVDCDEGVYTLVWDRP